MSQLVKLRLVRVVVTWFCFTKLGVTNSTHFSLISLPLPALRNVSQESDRGDLEDVLHHFHMMFVLQEELVDLQVVGAFPVSETK